MNRDFGEKLTTWYAQNRRNLPWRNTHDPYKIWLSEIILQQTRVNQGVVYYNQFVRSYPNIFLLAEAPADEIYKHWQGLGYYNRADNLMKTAKIVAGRYDGKFPEDFETLKTLPGIGDYTAAALASLAFGKKQPVVDGNVYRVLSRVFGVETPINTAKGKKEFTTLALRLMDNHIPADFNEALMEFGALYCVPHHPGCETCIFGQTCFAQSVHRQAEFPVKKPKAAIGQRYYYYFVIQVIDKGETFFYLNKRTARDIWRNLYDFPAVESTSALEEPPGSIVEAQKANLFGKLSYTIGTSSPVYQQQLTHLKVSAWFIPVFLQEPLGDEQKKSLSLVQQKQLVNFPVPRLIARYLQDKNLIK
jgi:A/G-specific adenine glycosylase